MLVRHRSYARVFRKGHYADKGSSGPPRAKERAFQSNNGIQDDEAKIQISQQAVARYAIR